MTPLRFHLALLAFGVWALAGLGLIVRLATTEQHSLLPPDGPNLEESGAVPVLRSLRVPPRQQAPPLGDDGHGGGHGGPDEIGRASGAAGGADRLWFAVKLENQLNPYRLMSAFVLPGEQLELEAVTDGRRVELIVSADTGALHRGGAGRWTWTAPPSPGIHRIDFTDTDSGQSMCIRAFVMTPYDGEAEVDGYRIGRYAQAPSHDDPVYGVPRGLVRVTSDDLDIPLSPHFRLGQFICKQAADGAGYLALRTRLLLKLEALLEKLNEAGVAADTFHVMSGYRTPHYNAAIGNSTRYSRHLYGDAADIFVDRDSDGRMDDLDGDGQVSVADARFLYDVVEGLSAESWYVPLVGGLGLYAPAPHRGPFVHVDARGSTARW